MKIKGYRILIKVQGAKKQTEWGFELIHNEKDQRMENSGCQTAMVLDVGGTCWTNKDGDDLGAWCKVGDKILFSKNAARFIHIPGELTEEDELANLELAIINDTDVIMEL